MGHAGAAGQDLREFTVYVITGFLAEEDGLGACRAPVVVPRQFVVRDVLLVVWCVRGGFESILRVCSAPEGNHVPSGARSYAPPFSRKAMIRPSWAQAHIQMSSKGGGSRVHALDRGSYINMLLWLGINNLPSETTPGLHTRP